MLKKFVVGVSCFWHSSGNRRPSPDPWPYASCQRRDM